MRQDQIWLALTIRMFIHLFIYLTEVSERANKVELFHLLVHAPDGQDKQGRAKDRRQDLDPKLPCGWAADLETLGPLPLLSQVL